MSRVPESLVGLLLIAALLAGCLGGEDGPETADDGEGSDSGPAQVSEDTGAIWGAVSSSVFEALGGARAELLSMDRVPTEHTATSSENGEFTISHVEPGQYILFLTRVNYEATQRSVTVQAGEITEVRFQLEPLPRVGPFQEVFHRAGMIDEAVAWQIEPPVVGCITTPPGVYNMCSGIRRGGTAGETRVGEVAVPDGWPTNVDSGSANFHQTDLSDIKTIMVELAWTPAGPFGEHFLLDMMCSDAPRDPGGGAIMDRDYPCYSDARGESPLQHRFDEDHWLEHGYNHTGVWAARVFATYGMLGTYDLTGIDFGFAYEQTFDKYWTVFHGEPAPEGYSGLPDA